MLFMPFAHTAPDVLVKRSNHYGGNPDRGCSLGIGGGGAGECRMHQLCPPVITQFGENSEAEGGLARQKDTCSLINYSTAANNLEQKQIQM